MFSSSICANRDLLTLIFRSSTNSFSKANTSHSIFPFFLWQGACIKKCGFEDEYTYVRFSRACFRKQRESKHVSQKVPRLPKKPRLLKLRILSLSLSQKVQSRCNFEKKLLNEGWMTTQTFRVPLFWTVPSGVAREVQTFIRLENRKKLKNNRRSNLRFGKPKGFPFSTKNMITVLEPSDG